MGNPEPISRLTFSKKKNIRLKVTSFAHFREFLTFLNRSFSFAVFEASFLPTFRYNKRTVQRSKDFWEKANCIFISYITVFGKI